MLRKKIKWNFIYVLKIICVPNFSSLGWFLFLSAVNSCWQLLTADDSCHKQNLNGIFIYPLKLIPVPNFSSLGWFSFLSAVNSCWQLLTADDSCHKKSLNGIFIYPLKLIPVPNFNSPGCLGARLESVTYVQTQARTDARTHRQTPGEYSANSGPAWQVPGPEFSKTPALLGWCQVMSWAMKPEIFKRTIILLSKQKPNSNVLSIEKKICNSVSFRVTEKFQFSNFMSRVFPTHFAKQTFA